MDKTKTVSLCMIVKNEEKFLYDCLNSVKDIVDEMIIIDTGSTDNSIAIANEFGAKIYFYSWNNNFSEARNYSITKATKDWILLMDGDDVLEKEDIEKVVNLINTSNKHGHFFKTLSIVDDSSKNYLYNLNLRLLKNSNEYEYKGAIHEQITHKFEITDYSNFKTEDIRIYHRGYTKEVSESKNKRERNIGILKEELKKYPYSPFHNFNMANEYFALGDIEQALKYYDIAYERMNIKSGYASKLILKRALCFIENRKYDKAIEALDKGLGYFENFTDIQFYKGYVYHKWKRYTLAIKAYSKAIEMGNAPIELEFINGCGTFRSFEALGNIYFELQDYEEAIVNYLNALKYATSKIGLYNSLAMTYKKLYMNQDKDNLIYKLFKVFNLEKENEVYILANILTKVGCDENVIGVLEKYIENKKTDIYFNIMGKALFNLNKYNDSFLYFSKIPKNSIYHEEGIRYLLLIKIIKNSIINDGEFMLISDVDTRNLFIAMYKLSRNETIENIKFDNPYIILTKFIEILDILLIAKELSIFENMLNILNIIDSPKILVELSKLYYKHGLNKLAIEEAIRSIKELGVIDEGNIEILYREI